MRRQGLLGVNLQALGFLLDSRYVGIFESKHQTCWRSQLSFGMLGSSSDFSTKSDEAAPGHDSDRSRLHRSNRPLGVPESLRNVDQAWLALTEMAVTETRERPKWLRRPSKWLGRQFQPPENHVAWRPHAIADLFLSSK